MPTYRIREYFLFADTYVIDAEDEDNAEALLAAYTSQTIPTTGVAPESLGLRSGYSGRDLMNESGDILY